VPKKSPALFALWYRPHAGVPWERATTPTRAAALNFVGWGGRKGGDWLICEAGKAP